MVEATKSKEQGNARFKAHAERARRLGRTCALASAMEVGSFKDAVCAYLDAIYFLGYEARWRPLFPTKGEQIVLKMLTRKSILLTDPIGSNCQLSEAAQAEADCDQRAEEGLWSDPLRLDLSCDSTMWTTSIQRGAEERRALVPRQVDFQGG